LKQQPILWNVYGDVGDILTKYVKYDFEAEWYNKFLEKYGDDVIINILKGNNRKIEHIPENEIFTFKHLQEKFTFSRLLDGSRDNNGKSIYDFVLRARKLEIEETFKNHLIENKSLINFSIEFEKITTDELDVQEEIEEIDDDDWMLACNILNEINKTVKSYYDDELKTYDGLKNDLNRKFEKISSYKSKFKNSESYLLLADYVGKMNSFIVNYNNI